MKFYVIEYSTYQLGGAPARIVETSKARTEKKLLELLQIDAFQQVTAHPQHVRIQMLDIPTPVRQDTVKDLLNGDIYKYRVDNEGKPLPEISLPQVHVNDVDEDEFRIVEAPVEGLGETVPADDDEGGLPF